VADLELSPSTERTVGVGPGAPKLVLVWRPNNALPNAGEKSFASRRHDLTLPTDVRLPSLVGRDTSFLSAESPARASFLDSSRSPIATRALFQLVENYRYVLLVDPELISVSLKGSV